MNLLDPSKMDVVKKSRLAKALNTLSLVSLLGALCASAAALILYLINSSLIYTAPWAIVAASAAIATIGSSVTILGGLVLGIYEWR